MDERQQRGLDGAWGLVLAGVEAALGAGFALRAGATSAELFAAAVLGFAVSYSGVRMLIPVQRQPIFRARRRWYIAMTVVLGGPLAASGLPYLGRVTAGQAATVTVLSAVGLYALVVFSTSPRRGGGWLMRATAGRQGWALCPSCGMATSPKRPKCAYCGSPTSGEST